MCSISGFCDYTRDLRGPEHQLAGWRMAQSMHRRGPDDQGLDCCRHCVLSHSRLAVIDPEKGAQPMTYSEEGRTWHLCYNGELYHADRLRSRLASLGHTFSTRSDTEVLLHACIEYGEQVGSYLEGIFAFAFWDGERLLLVRDRFGVKPLFYGLEGDTLLFASEIKGLFAYPGFYPRSDTETWQELLAVSPARTPGHGVFRGVRELRPGELAVYTREGLTLRRWYQLESRPHLHSYEETTERLRELLIQSVTGQLVSDVPLCSLLSGGLDSSVITAIAAEQLSRERGERLDTYSFDYAENDRYFRPTAYQPDADAPWVRQMSEQFHTRHQVLICPQEALAGLLEQAAEARDLPGMADVDASLLFFCREIRRNHTVALSGECSDEIFGGYPWFHRQELLEGEDFPWSHDLAARFYPLADGLAEELSLEEYSRVRCRESREETPRLEGETGSAALRREMGWLNLNWFMTNLLDRKDRMSMYSGLEVRVPFCDHSLVEYVWNIPWEMKSRGGVRKQVLRDAAKGLLPEAVRNRPKSPYPKTHHPLFTQLVVSRLREILADRNAPIHTIICRRRLERLMEEPGDVGRPWFGQLMAGPQMMAWLIQLNAWMERWHLTP